MCVQGAGGHKALTVFIFSFYSDMFLVLLCNILMFSLPHGKLFLHFLFKEALFSSVTHITFH